MSDQQNIQNPQGTTRLNFDVPDKVNHTLNILIPTGSKSDVMRKLVELYIDANREYGREFVIKLLDGKAKLSIKPGAEHNVPTGYRREA
jgi:hypothetical protein